MSYCHVYPVEDWIDHHVDDDHITCMCPCEPRIEVIVVFSSGMIMDEHFLIIHNLVRPADLAPDPLLVRLWRWLKSFFRKQ